MEPTPENITLIDTPSDETLFEGQTWGQYGVDHRAVISQNQNEPSFKNGWNPQSLSYIKIFLHCLPLKQLITFLLPSTSRATKEAGIAPLKYGDILRYLGLWLLMSTCYVWNREGFWSVATFDQEENPCPYRIGEFVSKCRFNAITRELRFTNTNRIIAFLNWLLEAKLLERAFN